MRPKIIFEDRQILVIDKPAGMVVNRAESVKGKTVQDWAEGKLKIKKEKLKIKDEFITRSGLVHRLDKETSGVMLLAKTSQAFENLKSQFKQRKVRKEYLALVHGKLEPKKGSINLPVARNPRNRMRFCVRLGGRSALTFYEVEKHILKDTPLQRSILVKPGENISLVRAFPKTGRTHQIRVHFKHIGHPIVSDPLYLSKKKLKSDKNWCPRLFLHAEKIVFYHPKTKKRMEFKSELPRDLSIDNFYINVILLAGGRK